jgi:hypothetical protein
MTDDEAEAMLKELDFKMLALVYPSLPMAVILAPATEADRQRMVKYAEEQQAADPDFQCNWLEIARTLGIQLVQK